MLLDNGAVYHPYLACLAFQQTRNGHTVEANLEAVLRYGMRAQRAGLTARQAMQSIAAMTRAEEEQGRRRDALEAGGRSETSARKDR